MSVRFFERTDVCLDVGEILFCFLVSLILPTSMATEAVPKQDKNPNAIVDFLLKNSEVGDTITDKNGDGYEITEVNTRKDGTKELIIVPFDLINGEKDYNYSVFFLI